MTTLLHRDLEPGEPLASLLTGIGVQPQRRRDRPAARRRVRMARLARRHARRRVGRRRSIASSARARTTSSVPTRRTSATTRADVAHRHQDRHDASSGGPAGTGTGASTRRSRRRLRVQRPRPAVVGRRPADRAAGSRIARPTPGRVVPRLSSCRLPHERASPTTGSGGKASSDGRRRRSSWPNFWETEVSVDAPDARPGRAADARRAVDGDAARLERRGGRRQQSRQSAAGRLRRRVRPQRGRRARTVVAQQRVGVPVGIAVGAVGRRRSTSARSTSAST